MGNRRLYRGDNKENVAAVVSVKCQHGLRAVPTSGHACTGTGKYAPKITVLPFARTSSYLEAVLDSGISYSPFTRWAGNRSAEFSTFILKVYNHLTLIPVNYYTSIYYIFF